jgi:hypothetical protein
MTTPKVPQPCAVDGCEKPAHARGWCPMHYQRWRQRGDPGSVELERQPQKGRSCSVDGCDRPARKTGWCASHYSMWTREGEVRPFAYKHAEPQPCRMCGAAWTIASHHRAFCSDRCRGLWQYHGGDVPDHFVCVHCRRPFPLVRQAGRYRDRSDRRICKDCRRGLRRHGMSVRELALRDGPTCRLCNQLVDLSLTVPDWWAPTVDHVLPRAHGGTNDPLNLQLARFICNSRRKDRPMA